MYMCTNAESYIKLHISGIVSELVKDDVDMLPFTTAITVLKIFGNPSYATVHVTVVNVKDEHRLSFLEQLKEKFGLDPHWLIRNTNWVTMPKSYNLVYKVPVSLIENLAMTYKLMETI